VVRIKETSAHNLREIRISQDLPRLELIDRRRKTLLRYVKIIVDIERIFIFLNIYLYRNRCIDLTINHDYTAKTLYRRSKAVEISSNFPHRAKLDYFEDRGPENV
jgi:hypothetical protein